MTLLSPVLVLILTSLLSLHSSAYSVPENPGSENKTSTNQASDCQERHYIFSWRMFGDCSPTFRGGTSKGAPVVIDTAPTKKWQDLQQAGISTYEQDRRAILAMTGGYRVSFEFIETLNFKPDNKPAQPYQSWGTEYVYVVEDKGDFISLQHIMVMIIETDKGFSDPIVMKHWRQDWQYQPRSILEYRGGDQWQTRRVGFFKRDGVWSQSVYQVDDSPRYASVGKWQHKQEFSMWESDTTWRPLPRRERTVRDDYKILEGINRHIILPTGWIQEEENLKRITTETTDNASYVGRELGYNRYQRITDFDWQPGDKYWQETQPFWAEVRNYWQQLTKQHKQLDILRVVDNMPMFARLFELAELSRHSQTNGDKEQKSEAVRQQIENALRPYIAIK